MLYAAPSTHGHDRGRGESEGLWHTLLVKAHDLSLETEHDVGSVVTSL